MPTVHFLSRRLIIYFLQIIHLAHSDLCISVLCPQGTSCDNNTGICRPFRQPDAGAYRDATTVCYNVFCPYGSSCDNNSGVCRPFRSPDNGVNVCANVICPSRQGCDINTGMCREFRTGSNKCATIRCPEGFGCDQNTGVCRQFRSVSGSSSGIVACDHTLCPQGTSCDTNTGLCQPFRPPVMRRIGSSDLCKDVLCPNGYSCNPGTRICELDASTTTNPTMNPTVTLSRTIRLLPPRPKPRHQTCPTNSHFEKCGSRCPYTCTQLKPKCISIDLNCIATCQCNDGYVQATTLNMTCVPAKECINISSNICRNVQCDQEMVCVDGYCNPKDCPPVVKIELPSGCVYDLRRDDKNCLILNPICIDL